MLLRRRTTGTGRYLKEQRADIQVVLADPPGSVLYNYIKHNRVERLGTGSVTEGIGQGRVTANLAGAPVDDALHVEDARSIEMVYRLLHEEGLFVGASSGLNVAAAAEVALRLPPDSTVVTVLCDSGARYARRLCSKEWLQSKGLLEAVPEAYRHTIPF